MATFIGLRVSPFCKGLKDAFAPAAKGAGLCLAKSITEALSGRNAARESAYSAGLKTGEWIKARFGC